MKTYPNMEKFHYDRKYNRESEFFRASALQGRLGGLAGYTQSAWSPLGRIDIPLSVTKKEIALNNDRTSPYYDERLDDSFWEDER